MFVNGACCIYIDLVGYIILPILWEPFSSIEEQKYFIKVTQLEKKVNRFSGFYVILL